MLAPRPTLEDARHSTLPASAECHADSQGIDQIQTMLRVSELLLRTVVLVFSEILMSPQSFFVRLLVRLRRLRVHSPLCLLLLLLLLVVMALLLFRR